MKLLSRRRFLGLLGAGAAGCAIFPLSRSRSGAGNRTQALAFTPVRLPHPLPVYTTRASFLASAAATGGATLPPTNDPFLAEYEILDDVVVAPEYERYVICMWGDRPFPAQHDYVGYNHDYTGFVPLTRSRRRDRHSPRDGLLWINHEYVSFPFHRLAPKAPLELRLAARDSFAEVVGFEPPRELGRELIGEMLYNMGGSVVRVKKSTANGRFSVVAGDPLNRRLHGLSGLALNRLRSDEFGRVTSWGSRAHQKGDDAYLIGTGPASREVFTASADGLGNRIIGTAFNCSGATTPWDTILSAEENFQHTFERGEYLGVTEDVLPNGTQTRYLAGTSGAEFGLVGEKYGWIVEIDPQRTEERAKKHTALGRFRHENVALRVEEGLPLIAYSGDDRRGGHVYKYVSRAVAGAPSSAHNSRLLEQGVLHVARFNPDGTGLWIPLSMSTPTDPNSPVALATAEREQRPDHAVDPAVRVRLPRRRGVAGQTEDGGSLVVDLGNESAVLGEYRGKLLGDFYDSLGAVLCDAYHAANLVGGTPAARPEDIEIHPRTREVFIAFTSGDTREDEGYPDSRVFTVGKYRPEPDAEQPHGGVYKLVEDSRDGAGTAFRWERLVQGGEAGAREGGGFANADNMLFDATGNLWCMTDTHSSRQNAGAARAGGPNDVRHDRTLSGSEARELAGVFGDNWIFVIADGRHELIPFCYGPPGCELTGLSIVGDTLIVSVQHPGEDSPINDGTPGSVLAIDVEMLDLNGKVVTQRRTVPRGSNWPSNVLGRPLGPPRPATIGIVPRRSGRA